MKKLNLSFILNETYFDLHGVPQKCNADIIKWNEIPKRTTEKHKKEFKSIFPSDEEEENTNFASDKGWFASYTLSISLFHFKTIFNKFQFFSSFVTGTDFLYALRGRGSRE